MEEKSAQKRYSFWSVFSNRIRLGSFFTKRYNSPNLPSFIKKPDGFTFIELVIVIAILGVLITVSIAIINPGFQLKKTRDAHRKSDLRLIQSGLELYRSDQQEYPGGTQISGAGGNTIWSVINCTPSLVDDDSCTQAPYDNVYIQIVPKDPKTGYDYYYDLLGNGYALYSCLENASDREKLPLGSTNPAYPDSTIISALGCTSGAYFAVTNP